MSKFNPLLLTSAVLCLVLYGFAFIAAPHSCEWGLNAYVAGGAGVILVLLLVWPVFAPRGVGVWLRLLLGLGGGTFAAGVWFAGLVTAHVRIICRLF